MTLIAWVETRPSNHPARRVLDDAVLRRDLLAGWSGPVSLRVVDPVLWLSVWAAGKTVRWEAAGLGGLSAPAAGDRTAAVLSPAAPALIWPRGGWEYVYSQAAVFEAIRETARLKVHGRGFSGPLAVIQGAASWFHDLPFAAGAVWWPDPAWSGRATDGERRVLFLPDLLGAFQEVRAEAQASTRIEEGVRVRSRRLHDGFWNGAEVVPDGFLDGWHMLRYPISEVS